jgi:hypothetical protein
MYIFWVYKRSRIQHTFALFLCITFLDSSGSLAVLSGCARRPLSAIRDSLVHVFYEDWWWRSKVVWITTQSQRSVWSGIFCLTTSFPQIHSLVKDTDSDIQVMIRNLDWLPTNDFPRWQHATE